MKKVLFAIVVAMTMVGCANKIEVKCPSCEIKSNDGNTSIDCVECTIDAAVSEDFSLFSIPRED